MLRGRRQRQQPLEIDHHLPAGHLLIETGQQQDPGGQVRERDGGQGTDS